MSPSRKSDQPVPSPRARQGTLRFSVDARHLRQLGRELVEDKVTAVTELIKNAYDADATTVTVSGASTERAGGTLVVADDGLGMSLDDVTEKWMRLSSDNKERDPVSPTYHRVRAGRKGIGRFSTETLGRRLVLRSTQNGDPTAVVVEFNWDDDFPAGHDLDAIENPWRTEQAPAEEHGTTLRIEHLHERWPAADWRRVRDAVRLLQPPFPVARVRGRARGTAADPGFKVSVKTDPQASASAEEDPNVLASLDDFLDAATATITGEITSGGRGAWRVTSDLFDLDDEQVLTKRFPDVGPLRFRVAYFVYTRDAIGDLKVHTARLMGNEYGGVRLYRDGLRVMPYGEPEDDWLGLNLEYRRRNVLVPIGTNNVFGVVAVTRRENPRLVDTASREGIVEGPALDQLRSFIFDGIIWGALRVGAVRQRKQRTTTPWSRPVSRAELVSDVEAELDEKLSELPRKEATQVRSLVHTTLEGARERATLSDAAEQSLLSELDLLRVLASLGSTIGVFSHEVTGILTRSEGALDDASQGLRSSKKAVQGHLDVLREQLAQLHDLSSYVTHYLSASRRRTRAALAVHNVLEEFGKAFANLLRHRSISIETETFPKNLRTTEMARSEFDAVLFNLLSNAVKALDREGQRGRRIRMSASRVDTMVVVRFEDNGCGIEASARDRIFDPFFTTTEGVPSELGVGTGLGLKVVRDIVTSYGGSVDLGEPSAGFVTSIEVRLPRLIR